MTYSQTETVPAETYRDQSEFADFLGRAEAQFVIPGLAESLIPQGMDLCDETGILYISGYSATSGKNSALLAVDTATGELTAEYMEEHDLTDLIRVVESVPPLHTPYVPLNSIVREFVGGSCYEY